MTSANAGPAFATGIGDMATAIDNLLPSAASGNRGGTNIATSESRTNVAYGTLTTPDQVTGIVLPANGLISVWYQATWQDSNNGLGRAAIFLNGNQLKVAYDNGSTNAPTLEAAAITDIVGPNTNHVLTTCPLGLISPAGSVAYGGDVTTGQTVAGIPVTGTGSTLELNGTVYTNFKDQVGVGGPCYIFAAAGTYTVTVQFKASAGSVTVSNRRLLVQALSFA